MPETALQTDAETGGAVAPGVGDQVELTIGGTVSRSEGGHVYITPTSANGQPIAAKGGGEEGEDAAIEEEIRYGRQAATDSSMALGLLLLLCLWIGSLVSAQAADLAQASTPFCSGTPVSNHVAVATKTHVYSVEVDNYTGATLYLMVFDSATNHLVNATPHFTPVPIATGTVGIKDWGPAGMPFEYGVNVCLSTTPRSLTNASGGGIVTISKGPRRP